MLKPSLAIAIPAYNEESSIGNTLRSLLSQNREAFLLDKIIVYCDGCTDGTVDRVLEIQSKSSLIHIVENTERIGKTHLLNQVFHDNTSDFLMVLDADIGLKGKNFLDTFVRVAMTDTKRVMFAAHQIPLRPRGVIGRMFHASFLMWDYVRLSVPDKDNVENFYGAATVYRKRFYETLSIPSQIKGMRTFLYLMAKKNGGFRYVTEVAITYWPPHTPSDYFKLRKRVYGSEQKILEKMFGDVAKNIGTIPMRYNIIGRLKFFLDYPLYALPAIFLNVLLNVMTKVTRWKNVSISPLWEVSISTKKSVGTDDDQEYRKRRKIIFSTYDDIKNPYYGGGGAFSIHEVAKRLVKKFEVTVITGNYPLAAKNEILDAVQYIRIGPSFLGPWFGQCFFHFLLWPHVVFRSFDVWIESFTPPISTSFLPVFTRKPVVGLAHMLSGEDMRRKYFFPFDWIEKIGLRLYSYCIATSQVFHEKIEHVNHGIKLWTIPNGVNISSFSCQKDRGEYILFLGRIEVDQKGLDILLEAYSIVQKQINMPLVIAGSGTERETKKLKRLIEKTKLGKNVKLLGKIRSNDEKKRLFQKAIFCVIPSRFETFSLVALESMASGTPLVSFDIDGLRWISSDSAIKIKSFNSEVLAKEMIELCMNEIKRNSLIQNGKVCAGYHDWSNIVNQYEVLISSILKK